MRNIMLYSVYKAKLDVKCTIFLEKELDWKLYNQYGSETSPSSILLN